MTDELHIRPATSEDVDGLVGLYRSAYETADELGFPSSMLETDADRIDEWLDDDESNLWVAEREGALVAAVRMLESRACPYGERLAVRPDAQREGLGTRLREFIEARARARGYETLQIATFDDHPFLVDHYRENGYEPFDRWESDGRPYDVIGLEKRL